MGDVQTIVSDPVPRGALAIVRVWRPVLGDYEVARMRVWEDNVFHGILLCSEGDYAINRDIGLEPRRIIAHHPDELIEIVPARA